MSQTFAYYGMIVSAVGFMFFWFLFIWQSKAERDRERQRKRFFNKNQ